jgi:hypothetical protein
MNPDALNQFFKKLAQDKAMCTEFVAFAAKHGVEFGELSDDELDNVAGGTNEDLAALWQKLTTLDPSRSGGDDQPLVELVTPPEERGVKPPKLPGSGSLSG